MSGLDFEVDKSSLVERLEKAARVDAGEAEPEQPDVAESDTEEEEPEPEPEEPEQGEPEESDETTEDEPEPEQDASMQNIESILLEQLTKGLISQEAYKLAVQRLNSKDLNGNKNPMYG